MKKNVNNEEYSIVAYMEDYCAIKEFVYEMRVDGSTVADRSCGELFLTRFIANATQEDIINKLKAKFKNVTELSLGKSLIFVKD